MKTFFGLIMALILSLGVKSNALAVTDSNNSANDEGLMSLVETEGLVESPASDFIYFNNDDSVTIIRYIGTDTEVVIPEKIDGKKVTTIDGAFANCKYITSIIIPTSVTSIKSGAFYRCESLSSIIIPEGVTSIEGYTFWDCNQLVSVTIPKGVRSIGDYAFDSCIKLTNLIIPEGVTKIGDYAFKDCWKLINVTLPEGVTSIGVGAFKHCMGLTNIMIPSSVNNIGERAFEDCEKLASISIPKGVTNIGICTFSNCSSLTNISIPASVNSIGSTAFSKCSSLSKIFIPDGVTSIEDYTFRDCSSLTYVILPPSVTSIGAEAFFGCSSLSELTLPEGVNGIGQRAFGNCSCLKSITIPDGVTSIRDSTFRHCSSLTSITIPEGVTTIGSYAFWECSNLTDVTIPEGMTSIDDRAFLGCSKLTTITIPTSVTRIGYKAIGHYYNPSVDEYYPYRDFKILGVSGSMAQIYAESNQLSFIDIVYFAVAYHLDGGVNDSRNAVRYDVSDKPVMIYNPTKNGYRFMGWYTDNMFTNQITDIPAKNIEDVDLYAKWKWIYSEYGYHVTIGGNFDLKYYLKASEDLLCDDSSYILFCVGDSEQKVKMSYSDGGYAVFICEVPPAQLTETVHATLYYQGQAYPLSDYSVAEYLNVILVNPDEKAEYYEAWDLVKAILNYGGYAQNYFGRNMENLANQKIDASVVTSLSDREALNMIHTESEIEGTLDAVRYMGYSLTCKSDTTLNVYYTLKELISGEEFNSTYAVKVIGGDNPYEINVADNRLQLKIKDISAVDLDNMYWIRIKKGSKTLDVQTSPFEYIRSAISAEDTSDSLKNLCKAILLYNQAAEKYYHQYSIVAR